MTTYLFSPFGDLPIKQKRLHYPAILTDVVRASSDAIEALSLFRNLLLDFDEGLDTTGFMAFDAHGGDTSCQLRAGMLREAFSIHRQLISNSTNEKAATPNWISENIEQLTFAREQAKDTCARLTKSRILATKLGFGAKQDTPNNLLCALGWVEPSCGVSLPLELSPSVGNFADQVDEDWGTAFSIEGEKGTSGPAKSAEVPPAPSVFDRLLVSATNLMKKILGIFCRNSGYGVPTDSGSRIGEIDEHAHEEKLEQGTTPSPTASSATDTLSYFEPSSSATSLVSADDDFQSLLQTKWDLLDSRNMVRFLVYSYVLSKYKLFCRLENVIGARLCPEAAADYGYKMMEPYWDLDNVEYKQPTILRITQEFRALQGWLSDFSCAWLQSLATRSMSNLNMERQVSSSSYDVRQLIKPDRLLLSTVQRSAKGLNSMACYPGYLLLRETLARNQCTAILIDRHFCSHGFHLNSFLSTLSYPVQTPETHSSCLGQKIHWSVARTSTTSLLHSPDQSTPHIVIMGNSIDGSYADYMSRIPSPNIPRPDGCQYHSDGDSCAENLAHVQEFLAADHGRLGLAFFASHKSYSFPLVSEEDETVFVARMMEQASSGDVNIKSGWMRSKNEADELGTGSGNLRVFGWQHMVLETKGRVARRVEVWRERGDMMPLAADVGVA